MALVSPAQITDGTAIDAADVNTPINQLATEINGNLDANNLATNAVSTAKIQDAAVTNAKLSTTAGQAGGAWKDWTPTFANLSGGTLTYAKYTQIGKTVHFKLEYVLAGAGVAGDVTFTTPTSIHADTDSAGIQVVNSSVSLRDNNGGTSVGLVVAKDGDELGIRYISSTPALGALSSTTPFTWASGDQIYATGTYEAA